MSRIGRKPITVPAGVDINIDGQEIRVKGPQGELAHVVHKDIKILLEDGVLSVERPSDEKEHRALHGLTRALVSNMVEGVTKGFSRTLEIQGVGFRATKDGQKVNLAIGFSHPVEIVPAAGIELEVPAPNRIIVKGIDKQLVGETAAKIRAIRPPSVYKSERGINKGIRYEGEVVRSKAGKAGKA